MPEASPLASTMTSGTTPKCSAANILPVRPMPDCTSSNTSRMPCRSQIARRPGQELARRHDVAAFAQHRLDDDGRHVLRADRAREQIPLDAVQVAVVGVVHARQQRAEVLAVLALAGGQRQRPQAAPVEAAAEGDQLRRAWCGGAPA